MSEGNAPYKVKINLDPKLIPNVEDEKTEKYLKGCGLHCVVTAALNSFVVTVYVRSRLIAGLVGHLEVMRVKEMLEGLKEFKGRVRVIAVQVHNLKYYEVSGARVDKGRSARTGEGSGKGLGIKRGLQEV